jgi:hypothetical protein
MQNLLDALADPKTCLNTTAAAQTVVLINSTLCNAGLGSSFLDLWVNFQAGYYDMPRKQGQRIESPDTLGRKCWAFALLSDKYNGVAITKALARVGMNANNFTTAFESAIPYTMNLCEKVMANCFVNATFDPSRRGSCPLAVANFHYLGFGRENIIRGNPLKYPFSE